MGRMRRRSLFMLAGVAGLAACGDPGSGSKGNAGTLTFANPLRVPPLLEPQVDADGAKRFALTMQPGRTEFLAGKPAATWGFNGSYLGPTIRAARGDRIAVTVTNRLPEASTVHWHGMRLPAAMDGGPHQMIAPGATWAPSWRIDQPAATSWYHPHPHGDTALHVYRGLAGVFLIDDPQAAALALPSRYGIDDVPLVLQDKSFDDDGALAEDSKPTWGLMGDHIVVNGTYGPHFAVTTSLVRFRIINGSNARVYQLGFVDNRRFHVIATDAGLLEAPVEVDRLHLSPGERAEIVVPFAAGEQVVMRSFAGADGLGEGTYDLLKLVAGAQLTASPALPARLAASAAIALPADPRVRRFRLSGQSKINGQEMDLSRIDEVVPAGAREIWEIENIVYAHNFHIHEVAFQVLSVDGKPPAAYATGLKDTVFVPGKSTVRLAVEFGRHVDPVTPYMYHCHILRHEDAGMMGQFVIVEPGAEHTTPRTIATTGPGHSHH
jgi:suppressor of ftsI